jgi:hypothetical protein
MKKTNKPNKFNKAQVIKDLATHFEEDFKKTLPITINKDGSVIFGEFLVKHTERENWGLYHINTLYLLEEYHLKTCALMAAKAYSKIQLNRFFEIKALDNSYWASFSDLQVYKKNIKTAKDFDRFCILLNKLEYSQDKSKYYQDAISKMFKWTFV